MGGSLLRRSGLRGGRCGAVRWFFTTPYLHPVFDRLLHSRYLRAPWQELLVMSWSGMRGAVSLAAALAVPLSTDAGDPFPGGSSCSSPSR